MKNRILTACAAAVLLITSLLCLAQDRPLSKLVEMTLFSNTVPASALTNSPTRVPIEIPPQSIMAIQAQVLGSGVDRNTGAVVFSFDISIDGRNWTTNIPYAGSVLADMTNNVLRTVTVGTNIPARFIALTRLTTTHTNAITVTNAVAVFLPNY